MGGTALVVLACLVLTKVAQAYLSRSSSAYTPEGQRERMVWARNVIWVGGLLAIAAIWASKIAGFAFSVAAFAGAILLVSKELLMCFLCYGLITVSHPYRVGDFVEINGLSGRVIDISGFSTTLAETGAVNQLTGKTLSFPNSMLLTNAVRNYSATGPFMVDLFRIVVPFDIDIEAAEQAALESAEAATATWREAADRHLRQLEHSAFIDLPSSKPKVLWASLDGKSSVMTVRFACPGEERVATEQAVFRGFWKRYRNLVSKPPGVAEPASGAEY